MVPFWNSGQGGTAMGGDEVTSAERWHGLQPFSAGSYSQGTASADPGANSSGTGCAPERCGHSLHRPCLGPC